MAPNSSLVSYVTSEILQPVFVTYIMLSSNKHIVLHLDDISHHNYPQIAAIKLLFILKYFALDPNVPLL